MKSKPSFRFTLTSHLIIFAVIPTLLIGTPLFLRIMMIKVEEAEKSVQLLTSHTASRLGYQINQVVSATRILANDSDLVHLGRTMLLLNRTEIRISSFLKEHTTVASCYYFNTGGVLKTALPAGLEILQLFPFENEIQNFIQKAKSDMQLNTRLFLVTGNNFFGKHNETINLLTNQKKSYPPSQSGLLILNRISYFTGELSGVLAVVVPLNYLTPHIVADLNPTAQVELFSTKQQLLQIAPREEVKPAEKLISGIKKVNTDPFLLSQSNQLKTSLDIQVTLPATKYTAPMTKLFWQSILGFGIILLILILVALWRSRKLSTPLKRLHQYVIRFGKRKYDSARPHGKYLEFDDTLHILETMGKQILEHIAETTSLAKRETELKKIQMEAEMNTLRGQMKPHFLFNASDADRARTMIENLATLYRLILDTYQTTTIPIQTELKIVESYLSIQQMRFSNRLKVHYQVEESSREKWIPGLIIQTLVENALKHGIGKARSGGEIWVNLSTVENKIKVLVKNTGALLPREFKANTGLQNTQKRLDNIYGTLSEFQLTSDAEGATLATFFITGEKL